MMRWLSSVGLVAAVAVTAPAAQPSGDDLFEKHVRPLFVEHCQKCHGPTKPKGGLDLSSRATLLKGGDSGPAIVPGQPEKSLLVQAVGYHDTPRMPPKEKLPDRDIAALAAWVKQGAAWPASPIKAITNHAGFAITDTHRRFWSFQPVRPQPSPAVRDATWASGAIDRFVLAKLEAKGLKPASAADRRTLLRRLSFDLTGLPPTLEEIDAFVADGSPDAYEKLVDRLLASPAYGERWGRHWLDLVRYTDSFDSRIVGNEMDCADAWRYRDWVVNALNADLPYDRFVAEQVAGDVLGAPGEFRRDGIVATGMLALGNWGGGDADKEKLLTDVADDQVDVVTRTFLGLTVSCARCHDHKFDPISTRDYYGLAGIFFSTHILPNVGPKTNGPPMLRIPLESPAEAELRKQQQARVAQLEREKADLRREAADAVAVRAEEYLEALARWHASTGKSRRQSDEAARQRGLSAQVLARLDEFLRADACRPLTHFVRDVHGRPGVHAVRGEADCPSATANTTGEAQKILTFTLPPRSVSVHPGPRSGVVIAWRSPVRGSVRIDGGLADADSACGNGIKWTLQLRHGEVTRELAVGGFGNGGRQDLPKLQPVAVVPGDRLELIVSPAGEYSCDTTAVTLRIHDEARTWELARDVLPDLQGAAAWSFLDTATDKPIVKPGLLAEWRRLVASARAGAIDRRALKLVARQVPRGRDGPFWLPAPEVEAPPGVRLRLARMDNEVQELRKHLSRPVEFANGAQEGGVPGSPHAGVHDVQVHVRGRYDRLGDRVQRRFPEVLTTATPTIARGSGRVELARWLGDPNHPLVSRVLVNRVWQFHFGRGIVNTPSNFGALGERPTHPELLDWLAAEFVRSDWSIKHLHRLILRSATYRQSAEGRRETVEADPDNLLYGRTSRRRLEAEAVRDSLLDVAGRLDRARGGLATRDFASPRRSLYQMTIRSDGAGFAPLFDAADSTQPVDKRTVSTVAPQALFLLNNAFVSDQVAALARRVQAGAADDASRLGLAYRLLYARPPLPEEQKLGLDYLASGGRWPDYCQVLLCANEFVYVD